MDTQGTDTLVKLLLGVNVATLITMLTFGYRVMRFINLLEFRVQLMWDDYEERTGKVYTHRRHEDA